MHLCFRVYQKVRICSAPKLTNMLKGEDGHGHGKDVLCYFINHTFILSIYGYYPNVEYRRSPLLVVKDESVQYINC